MTGDTKQQYYKVKVMEDFISPKEEQNELKKYSIKEVITGSVLKQKVIVRQLPFIIFIVLLAMLYIANRYHAEHLLRESTRLQEELNELRAESITVASELMFASRQSQVLKLIEENNLGLKESRTPPKWVKMRD
jgi:cell division protein FtsL